MNFTDYNALYEDDANLTRLKSSLETESGEAASSIEKAIRSRKKELREAHDS